MDIEEAMALIGNARIMFWQCPDHQGKGNRVEWDENEIAHCLTCGRTSTNPQAQEEQ
jgi:hypothetical protein